MKILFFILGSISNRIDAWGQDNYKILLEQDIIFYGPIYEKEYKYNDKQINIINIDKETTINSLFERLPDNWYPDIVVCDTSITNFIIDIYNCPVKTLLLARDSWADLIYNKGVVEFYDFYSYGVIDKDSYINYKSNQLPLFGFPVSLPDKNIKYIPFDKRKIDVLSIANVNDGFYHERYKMFYKIAMNLPSNINVKFVSNIKRSEIHRLYNNSKIVIDWSHTLSNRSVEAALNNCLFFCHESNRLISEYWKPNYEYIPFNETNFLPLINKYLNDSILSNEIISNANKRLKNSASSFGEALYKQIKIVLSTDVNIKRRIEYNNSLEKYIVLHRTSTMFYFNYNYSKYNYPSDWESIYFKRINKAIKLSSDEYKKILLIESSRMSFLLKDYNKANSYLNDLERIFPEYSWIYYFQARIYQEKSELELAKRLYLIALDKLDKSGDFVNTYIMPFKEKANIIDERRIVSYMWGRDNNNLQVEYLYSMIHKSLSDVLLLLNEKGKAIEHIFKAFIYIKTPELINVISGEFFKTKKYNELLELSLENLKENPYHFISNNYLLIAYINLGNKYYFKNHLKQQIKALSRFVGSKRNKIYKYSYIFILMFYPILSEIIILKLLINLNKIAENRLKIYNY